MSEVPKSLPEVKEADKPFWLAMIFIGIFAMVLIIGAVGAFFNNSNVTDYIDKVTVGIMGIVGTVVGFYFKSKKE